MLCAGTDSAYLCLIPAGGYHQLVVPEQLLGTFVVFRRPQVGVSAQLVNAFGYRIGNIRRFALNHRQRQAVHEADNIRDDVLVEAFNLELVGAQEFVVVRVVEVDDLDRLPLATGTEVLFNGQVVHQQVIDGLVVLHQTRVIRVGELTDDFAKVFVTDPRVQPEHGSFQAFGQNYIPVVAP